jgi:glyoxylase-like metal-dependent hydrolase (beta-lactamase superfamily II)/ferredoxin
VEGVARVDLRHPANAAGDWFVDERCIDCGTCRDVAPALFGDVGPQSVVISQPTDPADEIEAWLAAQACPTQSIGTETRRTRPGRLYPREITPHSDVFDCGYCSPDSFGATAWFARRPSGNLMVDSPRFTSALLRPLQELGGVQDILLTHRDDVADADRWADAFGSRVWIHADDAQAAPFATDIVEGDDPVELRPRLIAAPVPGHTKGSAVFLLDDTYLFSGDSLAWSHARHDLVAFRDACWWSWPAQTDSLERLAAWARFSWVLPGHGARVHADDAWLHERLCALVGRMRTR